jgi:hypothetical protein
MPRTINTQDEWLERLLKLIPSEIVGIFIFINSIIPKNETIPLLVYLGFVVALFIATPFYLIRLQFLDWNKDRTQIVMTSIAFLVWAFAIGGFDFVDIILDNSWIKGAVLALFTLFVTIFSKQK